MMLAKFKLFNKNSTLNCGFCRLFPNKLCANAIQAKSSNVEVMQKVLRCPEKVAIESISSFDDIRNLSGNELQERLGVMQELGVADINNKNFISLAKFHVTTLKNRILIMQECGFQHDKINPVSVKKYLSLTHWNINKLKDKFFIEKSTDVYKLLLNHAQLVEHYTPISDSNNLVTVKMQLLRLLLKHEIGISDDVLDNKREILKRLKNKSIRVIKRNIDIAKNILGMSSHKICRNPFILWSDPDNTLKVIEEIKEIGGIDIKICMSLYPKIIIAPYENTKEILQCLKEFNFSNDVIQRAVYLFTLSSNNVRNRLIELEKEEFFNVFKQHPRVLILVYYYNKIKLRLQLLRELNVQNASLSQISTSSQQRFDKYYANGALRYPGHDILNYISSEFRCDKQELRNVLKRCPFWRYVPLIEIAKNLKLLRERGFSDDYIFCSVYILFYNTSKIIEELNALDKKEGIECCKENGLIKKEFILPLVIYFIERSYNFDVHPFSASGVDTHSDIVIPGSKEENGHEMFVNGKLCS